MLVKKPMVADPTRAFVLQADGSNYGLGAILSQEGDDGEEHPVTCAIRKLLPREVKFATIKTESLGIMWDVRPIIHCGSGHWHGCRR